MNARPACEGRWELFDSLEPSAHEQAAAICATCPMLRECRAELATAKLLAPAAYAGPQGTWAGKLIGSTRATNVDKGLLAREEALFDDREAKDAHAAYMRGDRGAWAATGHKVYDRRRRRAAKERAREAVA